MIIENFAKQPRALARNADGSRVFVSVFESGNQTTIVPEPIVGANGGLPPSNPAVRPGLPAPPNTGLIVKWDGSNWRDETNKSWTAQIPYTLADVDVVQIDTTSSAITARVRGSCRSRTRRRDACSRSRGGSRIASASLVFAERRTMPRTTPRQPNMRPLSAIRENPDRQCQRARQLRMKRGATSAMINENTLNTRK